MKIKTLVSFLVILSVALTAVLCSCEEARFEASNLTVEPSSVMTGKAVYVTVDVANTGGAEDNYNVILLVNGTEESSESVTLAPDTSQTVTFRLTRDVAGEYEIRVNGLEEKLTVIDFDEILEKTFRAMSDIDTYHFICTIDIELPLPEDSTSLFEDMP